MPESMRDAVDGFERQQLSMRDDGLDYIKRGEEARLRDRIAQLERAAKASRSRFRRADVLDLVTAANDERATAIAAPKLAESCKGLAARLSDLAERIAALLEEGE
jgi:hypothetical protein